MLLLTSSDWSFVLKPLLLLLQQQQQQQQQGAMMVTTYRPRTCNQRYARTV
jgi:hypothetical protein